MAYKIGAVELSETELVEEMKRLNIEPPQSLEFPYTHKLDEKYTAHFDKKGFLLRDGKYVPGYARTITKNQVVQLEERS